jgi:hypothetical protein
MFAAIVIALFCIAAPPVIQAVAEPTERCWKTSVEPTLIPGETFTKQTQVECKK